jgi:hypothetical protein
MVIKTLSFLILLFITAFVTAITHDTREACYDISKALPGKLFYPNETAYLIENKDYWNVGLAGLGPACISLPESPQDVSAIVKIIGKYDNAKFAVKSGGHDPAPGFSSSREGVLIALRHINGTVLDQKRGVAYVKPGGHWRDVIVPLEAQGYTVVGGRLGMLSTHSEIWQILSNECGRRCWYWWLPCPRGTLILERTARYGSGCESVSMALVTPCSLQTLEHCRVRNGFGERKHTYYHRT